MGYQPLPEHMAYLGPNHARPRRKFRLFRRREKPKPKQEHISLFEVLPDGPYAGCERCHSFLEALPEAEIEVFYEKEKGHRHLFQSESTARYDEMDARLYYDKYDLETTRRISRIADDNGIKVVVRWVRDSRLIDNDQR